jgi:subtilisin family serine protease
MNQRLVVVDSAIYGYQQWLESAELSGASVLILRSDVDGVEQIAAYLTSTGLTYDALHIISHGSEGAIYLGTTRLSAESLTSYDQTLKQIGASISPLGDILLYGCDVARGDLGVAFINSLAQLTGADVVASEDLTGLAGDSDLEFQSGKVDSARLSFVSNLPTLLSESEANDTLATADAATLGSAMNGQLSTSSDVDWYSFSASGSGTVSVVFDAPTNSIYSEYFTVGLYDGSGSLLRQYALGTDSTLNMGAVAAAGTYYLKVHDGDYYYSGGAYTATVNFTAGSNAGFEEEPNDDYANALVSGSVKRGQIATTDDVDWFYLDTQAAGNLAINFDAPTASGYSEYFNVWVFDEAGNLLASKSTGQDISFAVNAPDAGSYFVAVTSGDYYHDTGQYALTITSTESTVNRESEANDSNSQADALALGTNIYGQLSAPTDDDRYVVTLVSSGKLTVNFDGPTNSTYANYFYLSVYDSTGALLATRDTGSDTAFDVNIAETGNYYVSVSAANYYFSDGEYRLSVSALLDDPIPDGAITGTPLGDKITGTANADLIYGLGGNDQINGGDGVDTVVFRSLLSNLSINTIDGFTAIRGNYAAGNHAYSVSRLWNVEKLQTWSGTENLGVTMTAPVLGTQQSEVIVGTSNNDLIDGLGGSDFIDGKAGADTLALFGAKDQFTVQTVAGITRIKGSEATQEYARHTIKTVDIETLAFNQSQTRLLETNPLKKIFGTATANVLTGSAGDDIIDGQGGNDQIDGGAGQDTLVFFGKSTDFSITFPTVSNSQVTIVGNSGTEYAGQTAHATNIETLAFLDRSISVINLPKVVLSPATTYVTEGGSSASLQVSLSVAPTSAVTVMLNGGSQLSASTTSLSFDAINWSTPQAVTIGAIDDSVFEQQHSGTLTVSVSSTDVLYTSLTNSTLAYTISDNEVATTGSVSGRLWNDVDKDKTFDANEAPLANWTVFDDDNRNGRLDSGEVNVRTDVSGAYRLDGLAPGSHAIVAKTEMGWVPTYPAARNASPTIVTNTASSGEVSVETLATTVVTEAIAQSVYANLGTATNIAAFHADPRFSNIKGQGYSVVVIDTGIDLDHPYFGPDSNGDGVADRIVYQYDFFGSNDSNASDGNGHGTHVAGIIGSSNTTYPGIAPKINVIALKVFSDSGRGDKGESLREAANWVVQNSAKYNVVAVNLSLGFGDFDTQPVNGFLNSQFSALTNSGVVVVSASGNDYLNSGGKTGVAYPSSDPYSLSVGAVWAGSGSWGSYQTGTQDAIAVFSQRDDTESDIFAPGVLIDSAWNDGTHKAISGTSMASPEIAGMVALAQQLAEQELGRRLTFDEVRNLLKTTGDPIVDGDDEKDTVPNTGLTFHRVDMLAMAEAILDMKQVPQVSHVVDITSGTVVSDKNFGFATTQFVQGVASDDLIVGTAFGEFLNGGNGLDKIIALDGDDFLFGESGNDVLDGGLGFDVAKYSGSRSDYIISYSSGYLVVADKRTTLSNDGSDSIFEVESLMFSDQSIFVDSSAPTPISFSPSDNSANAAVGSNIVLTFSEAIQRGTGNIEIRSGSATGTLVESFNAASSAQLAISGSTLTIDPTNNLNNSTQYFVTFASGSIKDLAGNNFAGTTSYDFTTAAASDGPDAVPIGGKVYHWKTGALLSGVEVEASPVMGSVGGGKLFELRAGAMVGTELKAELWVNLGSALVENLDVELGFGSNPSVVFTLNSGVTGWTLLSEQGTAGGLKMLSVGGFAGAPSSALTGSVKLGDITASFGAGQTLVDVGFISGEAGTQALNPYGVQYGSYRDTTDLIGTYEMGPMPMGLYEVEAFRALTSGETGSVISSADALAALKIAVGRNPNSDNSVVSPYQFISADVNEDGRITSADALAILKMAVKRSDAPAREWIFVDEKKDFWNEATSTFTTTRTSVPKPADLAMTVDTATRTEVNLVAMLKGDVNGSWAAPAGSVFLPDSYFEALASANPNTINIAQFG